MAKQANKSVITGPAIPGRTGVVLLARVRASNGQLITQASLSSIAYTVSNVTLGTTLGTGTFTISSTVFDALQQGDVRWQEDSADEPGPDGVHGFNFAATLDDALFVLITLAAPGVLSGPASPQLIQCDVAFTPTSGEPWRVAFRWQKLPVYG